MHARGHGFGGKGGLVHARGACEIAEMVAASARFDGAAFRHAAGGGVGALVELGYSRVHVGAGLVLRRGGICKYVLITVCLNHALETGCD